MGFGICVRVRGPRACFTRPELHSERVSYDVITPSAARGVLEAVYWKPAITWVIDRIAVINPIRFETIRRNEVGSKLLYSSAERIMRRGKGTLSLNASADRQQRNTLYLADVDYVISAHFEMTDKAGDDDTEAKHYNIMLRRLRSGGCFNQPYLGCREFPAQVELIEDGKELPRSFYGDQDERDLGYMLYDLDFSDPKNIKSLFFRAVMMNGEIDVATARREVVA